MSQKRIDLSYLLECWPGPYVPRPEMKKFSCGMVDGRTLANIESRHRQDPTSPKPPAGAFRLGNRVVYPAKEIVTWLEERARPLD